VCLPSRPVIERYPQDEDELTLLLWDSSIVCERLPGPLKLWEYDTDVVWEYETATPALRLVFTFIPTPFWCGLRVTVPGRPWHVLFQV
jgi:hypothetical protein